MAAPSSLCPGYKHVEAFGPHEEYEDEEEVFYVTLDMGNVEPTLVPSSSSYRLIVSPWTVLKGRHDLLLGTELIFTDDKGIHDWNKRSVVHVANTEQRIAFQEVTLIPKVPSSKGKEKATDEGQGEGEDITINFQPPEDDRSVQIERMTGLSAPPGRLRGAKAPQKRKQLPGANQRLRPKRRKNTNQDLKAQSSDAQPMNISPPRDDMDDMYMDI
ncbi:hypothetical protein BDZ97DRAFT_1652038 [Flammula alnicola]|nr:hypothetical protein BDZ97DRAFT_1652038 [Flammula alnicola]